MNKEDRRVRKTKNALINSLMKLLDEKSIKSVTVTDICEGADVNRSTFYQYYSNPFDMLEQIEAEIYRDFVNEWEKQGSYEEKIPVSTWLELIYLNRGYSKLIFGDNGYSDILIQLLSRSDHEFQEQIKTLNPKLDHKDIKYIGDYCTYGTVAIITKWANGGFKESIEHIAEMISMLNGNALRTFP